MKYILKNLDLVIEIENDSIKSILKPNLKETYVGIYLIKSIIVDYQDDINIIDYLDIYVCKEYFITIFANNYEVYKREEATPETILEDFSKITGIILT